ncbi:MAG TPA: hypothetical protein P5060_00230 [Candidatus Absconditabacterales bacterium]|nr:hypothetical protein [Candidatus Absconditabacterales bacterium]
MNLLKKGPMQYNENDSTISNAIPGGAGKGKIIEKDKITGNTVSEIEAVIFTEKEVERLFDGLNLNPMLNRNR